MGRQVAIGVGFLAASAYTLQQWVLPHLVSWIRGTPSKTAEEKSLGEMVASAFQKQARPPPSLFRHTPALQRALLPARPQTPSASCKHNRCDMLLQHVLNTCTE